jgi:general stress protein YciG
MATDSSNDTSNRGLGSNNMDEQTKKDIQSKGGKASAKSSEGAAGSTDAARRGGENSNSNQ